MATTLKTPRPLPASKLLRRSELTQWDVAHQAEVSQGMVSLVLRGHVRNGKVEEALRTLLREDFTEDEIFGSASS
jgi:hypothetical protein